MIKEVESIMTDNKAALRAIPVTSFRVCSEVSPKKRGTVPTGLMTLTRLKRFIIKKLNISISVIKFNENKIINSNSLVKSGSC